MIVPLPAASAAGSTAQLVRTTAAEKPSPAAIGLGVVQASSTRVQWALVQLVGVMQTPEEVTVMRDLLERGWCRRRITCPVSTT